MDDSKAPQFAEWVVVDDIDLQGFDRSLEASPEERVILARRFGLLELKALKADLHVQRIGDEPLIQVTGRLSAVVVQNCVVTLEPTSYEIDEEIDENFGPNADLPAEVELSEEDDGPPEPFDGEGIDLGEVVAQHLALGIDLYPRAPGVEFPGPTAGEDAAAAKEAADGPFAALATLKEKKDRDS